jgi:hypothetical protein
MLDEIEHIAKYIRQKQNNKGLRVNFFHGEDRDLIFSQWDDQYYGSVDDYRKRTVYEYSYEITSKGISFVGFSERDINSSWWETKRHWYSSGDESTMRLIDIPNIAPPKYKGTMYLFHQDKIKETLSTLPAWAIAIMSD